MICRRFLTFAAFAVTTASTPGAAQPPASASPEVQRAVRDITAAEAARLKGDTAAWKLVVPEFFFAHSTGGVDDLSAFFAGRGRGLSTVVRAPRTYEAEPAVDRLLGDVFVRTRLLADSVPPAVRSGRTRVMDVYVRRDGSWHWLAHQTSQVLPRWVPVSPDHAVLDEYAGTYAAADGRKRSYVRRDDAFVELPDSTVRAPTRNLVPLSEATFGYDGLSGTITFLRDRTGKVAAAEVSSAVGFSRFVRVK